MVALAFLQWTPAASAILWFGAAGYQAVRDRYHTWTEIFLLFMFFFVGLYALTSVALYTASDPGFAEMAALAGLTCIVLAAAFFLLYGLALYWGAMRRRFLIAFVPVVGVLVVVWTVLIDRVVVNVPETTGVVVYYEWPWIWLSTSYMLAYPIVGMAAFFKTYREIHRQSPRLARRMGALLVAVMITFGLGAGTDILLGLLAAPTPPLFATTLVIPGAIVLYAISPLGELGIPEALRRARAHNYDIKAVFLTYQDSTLIGAKSRPEEESIDQDLFTSTLGVIQNFMRTSFPSLRGGFLRTISLGGYTLVIERGRHTFLILVIEGRETDPLRRQMRDALRAYEERNRDALARWRGVPADAAGTDETLDAFFREGPAGGT